jgi:hypothetical protein
MTTDNNPGETPTADELVQEQHRLRSLLQLVTILGDEEGARYEGSSQEAIDQKLEELHVSQFAARCNSVLQKIKVQGKQLQSHRQHMLMTYVMPILQEWLRDLRRVYPDVTAILDLADHHYHDDNDPQWVGFYDAPSPVVLEHPAARNMQKLVKEFVLATESETAIFPIELPG